MRTPSHRRPPSSAGNEHLDRLLSDPKISADVAQARAEAEEMDRIYAMNHLPLTHRQPNWTIKAYI